jgi:hypothetical protein
MKKYLLIISILFYINSYSQVSIEYINIITSAAEYTYVGINYKPDNNWMTPSDWDRINNLLSARQAMYERGHGICKTEFRKLMNLNLINDFNKQKLTNFQRLIKQWADANYRNIDLSIQSNVNSVLKYITSIYNDPDIRNEIRVLNELNSFYQYINDSDPYQVNKGQLYDEFNSVMQELKFYSSNQLMSNLSEILKDLRKRKYNDYKTEIYKRFYAISKSPKVSNGWHLVYFLQKDGTGYGRRSVFVINGKVTIYKRFNGKEENIISGGTIVNQYCKSAIYNSLDTKGVFNNVDVELFFMD